MTKGTGYSTFNTPNRSWTVGKLAQRLTSNLFLECCSLPCYPKSKSNIQEELSDEGMLQERSLRRKKNDDLETEEPMEMKRMSSRDSSTEDEMTDYTNYTNAGCSLMENSSYEILKDLQGKELISNAVDSEGKTFASSGTSFGIKRVVKCSNNETNGNSNYKGKKEFENGESDISKMFPKRRLRKVEERDGFSSQSELFLKCRIRKRSQQSS